MVLTVVGLALSVSAGPAHAAAPGPNRLVSHLPASPTTTSGQHGKSQVASADGAYVAFASRSSGLVPGQADGNAWEDVFLWERATGTIRLVSHAPSSATLTGNAPSDRPAISADGAYVAFSFAATNLVTGQVDVFETNDLFLWERATGTVRLISHTSSSSVTAAGADDRPPAMTANGSHVAFTSSSSNIVAGQTDIPFTSDVFLYDRVSGTSSLVSRIPGSATTTGNDGSYEPSISADGAFVAFRSDATNLVTGEIQGNSISDNYLWTRATGGVTLISHAAGSATTTADWGAESGSTNLVPGRSTLSGTSTSSCTSGRPEP